MRSLLALILSLAGLCIPARADEPVAAATADERIAQLEARIEASQRRLNDLQQVADQLTAAPEDKARTEAMKQQIREVLSEREFRESIMPSVVTAGYDKGFYIRSSDEAFLMKLNARMQFRWTNYGTQARNRYQNLRLERDDRTGFDIQRLRFGISGHAYTKDLTYRMEFAADSSNTYDVVARYIWANYKFTEEFQFMAGLFKIASTRGQMTSSGSLQMVDRSMTDAVFQLDRGVGVRFWGQLFEKRLDYFLDVVNSFNGLANRTITPDPAEMDSNPGVVFHAIWHALGDNPGHDAFDMMSKDFSEQGDNALHETPALDLGFHYAFNEDDGDQATTRIPFPQPRGPGVGGFGLTSTNGLQINQFGWDAAFKFMGFSTTGEYLIRLVDPRAAGGTRPWSNWWLLSGDDSTTAQQGAYVQVGYFLPIPGMEKKLEAVARVGGISALANSREGSWEYAGGLNYYMEGNRVKLQTDLTKVYEAPISSSSASLANVNDSALIWRVQLQVGL